MGRAFEYRKERKFKRWGAMAKAFTRIGKEIAIAVKEGGPHAETNARLRQAIQNAKGANMPKDRVENAIKKASSKDTSNYEEVSYEGYAPHGVAVVIDTQTDNPTRTVANIRSYFNKLNGSLGNQGAVSYMFKKYALFKFALGNKNTEDLELELIDAGLTDLQVDEDTVLAYADFTDFGTMAKKLEDLQIEVIEATYEKTPDFYKEGLSDEEVEEVIKLIEKLEEDDDVSLVFHNMK
ncbi:MAG: YebC/PmpR family DNA-binding transcriptional regulator [Chitinophagales bacterium]|nr:YebC/PmpR family DNA-binding transcriptional regulator [Chitinophagales bacterium]MCO5281143.1 YebC/PmpR family DNA-binding transcriptional regulator [Chitinophagales bacterium]OJV30823.1 MAG: transcriptional regulator [Bacteroidetes bacterium 37-13]HRN93603.1 YebC/PmpR family DNA-binding transcriptional regulator [Chitinophagales bacterium]HRP39157.1 YebC/PmpR family DNA-binding transcriptional regulator [Chitinophagales bacterium]